MDKDTMSDKLLHAVGQAQQWQLEARSQRATVLEILRYFRLPEHDWEALRLIQGKFAAPAASAVPQRMTDEELDAVFLVHGTTGNKQVWFTRPEARAVARAIESAVLERVSVEMAHGIGVLAVPAWVALSDEIEASPPQGSAAIDGVKGNGND